MNRENIIFDALLQWDVTNACSFSCEYCFYVGVKIYKSSRFSFLPSKKVDMRKFSKINNIKIKKLLKTLERTQKTFLLAFTGGEPFMVPNFVGACVKLSKEHYIMLNTNFTHSNVPRFIKRVAPGRVRSLTASLHIRELERRGLVETFMANASEALAKGFKLTVSTVAYPPLFNHIKKYQKIFLSREIPFVVDPFFGQYKGQIYPGAYSKEEVDDILNGNPLLQYHRRGQLCNAGYNFGVVNAEGEIRYCHSLLNSLGHVYKKISLRASLIECPVEKCACPLCIYVPELFAKAKCECGV